jgi:hypothetical protein
MFQSHEASATLHGDLSGLRVFLMTASKVDPYVRPKQLAEHFKIECMGEAQPAISRYRTLMGSHQKAVAYAATEVAVIRRPPRTGSLKLPAYSLAAGRLSRPKIAFSQTAKASNF